MKIVLKLLFFLLLSNLCVAAAGDTLLLFKSAYLLRSDSSELFKAEIPGSVYTDLYRNKKIPDPFYGNNEISLKWIENENWIYIDTFSLTNEQLKAEKIDLLLEGIDTYADVYLNGEKILSCSNMFVSYKTGIKEYCKPKNILKIHIKPVNRIIDSLAARNSFELPGGNRVYARKAAFNFGWDFAPDLRAGGIWKPVKLIFEKKLAIKNIRFEQTSLTDIKATGKFIIRAFSDQKRSAVLKLNCPGAFVDEIKFCELTPGENEVTFNFTAFNPRLWTTNGNGIPEMYHFGFEISSTDSVIDQSYLNVGFRNLKLIQEKDSIGESFYFLLNGKKLFCKGANIVPPEYFSGTATDSSWIAIVNKAVNLNMNMLRVWGGGVYPPQAFYDACDKNGILVWQDFMFACAMYPADVDFFNSVSIEAEQAIINYRNHPSLALWCGNNENLEGWYNWGWQKEFRYSKDDSLHIIAGYKDLFEKLLPQFVSKLDVNTAYWPSSPSIGWGRSESMLKGDSHYWGVWWGMEPFEMYKRKVPRFMSEYGFQSLPSHSSVVKFAGTSVRNFSTPEFNSHQKNVRGFETIENYLKQYYNPPKDFRSQIYLSEILQAKGLQTAIHAHRSYMPGCMGSLIWQLNDCWPGISWSLYDYYGSDKAAAYRVRTDFDRTILAADLNGSKLSVKVISDSKITFPADLNIRLIDFDGNIRWTYRSVVLVNSDSAIKVFEKDLKFLQHLYDPYASFISVELSEDDHTFCSQIVLFKKEMELKLKRPSVSMKKTELPGNVYRFEISVNSFAKNVELSVKDNINGFSDNYFDMIPDTRYIIDYFPGHEMSPGEGLNIRSLVDTF